ncbi:unnamed protein product, partial [Ixodes pacificus]
RRRRPRAAQGRAVGTIGGRSELVVAEWWRRRTSLAPPSKEPDPRGPRGGEEGAGGTPTSGERHPSARRRETRGVRERPAVLGGSVGDGRVVRRTAERRTCGLCAATSETTQPSTRRRRPQPFVRSATSWWCARRSTPGASSTRRGIRRRKTQRPRPLPPRGTSRRPSTCYGGSGRSF